MCPKQLRATSLIDFNFRFAVLRLFGAVSLIGFSLAQIALANDNPHEVNATSTLDCQTCHVSAPKPPVKGLVNTQNHTLQADAYKLDGIQMCSSCHNPNQGHKVGLKIDFNVPADMPLTEENDVSCLTCHYTHGHLSADKPHASVSFLDRLANSERLRKSFLLRRNNSDGELCLICHNVSEGTK